ncbi:hypothetical protein SAE02_62930 [Skermanella aerolata]|uniref:Uncharacterized protein n=1 Tax=Skermanella aerolata TaxID=393310 RepID=A0A512E0C9_9PROT|nr:hypothetical protein [Skermanella aerolata]KJB91359.1 hypothetical protein N826_30835 [Skermanella aerolata KACC 11604]GEO42145.1 hypothetical protein SAE02_62930 [Skermanella aerolata]
MVSVGAILVKPHGIDSELFPIRFRTLERICRKLMAPGLYRGQEGAGRQLLERLLRRDEKPLVLEVVIGVLLTARLCDQDIDPKVRAIVAVVRAGLDPDEYEVRIFHEPFDRDLMDAEEVSALVASMMTSPDGDAPSARTGSAE